MSVQAHALFWSGLFAGFSGGMVPTLLGHPIYGVALFALAIVAYYIKEALK